jgi:hypothetical protein
MSLLFVMNASAGSLESTGNGALQLTLDLEGENDLWFSDRPERRAGSLDVDGFIASWSTFFAADPPNAVLTVDAIGRQPAATVPLTLERPSISESGTVSFVAKPLESSAAKGDRRGGLGPTFGAANLFIDDGALDTPSTDIQFDIAGAAKQIAANDERIQQLIDGLSAGGLNNEADLINAQRAMQNRQLMIETISGLMEADEATERIALQAAG